MDGGSFVANAPPDGYTLLLGNIAGLAINAGIYPKMPYDATKDFTPIVRTVDVNYVLVVHSLLPVKTVAELLAYARANPGKLTYGSAGSGSLPHLGTEILKVRTGIDMVHVPYKGGGPALQDVMGGQVPVFFANMASSLPHVKTGKVRALAVTGSKRSPSAPDLPTIAEAGVPGYEVYEWNAVFAPAGTPADAIAKTHSALARALAAPEVKERITALGGEASGLPPAETAKWLQAQVDKWARVVKDANIRLE